MAEARLGVDPRPTVSRVGFEVDTGRKETQVHVDRKGLVLYVPHPRFLLRNLRKKVYRLYTKCVNACAPFPPIVPVALVTGVTVWVVNSPSNTWQRSGRLANFLWSLDSWSPITRLATRVVGTEFTTPFRVGYLSAYFSFGCVAAITFTQRFFLRHMLNYHGWLEEAHAKKKSKMTIIWGLLMRYVFIRNGAIGGTYVYQDILPSLPVPKLEDTIARYVESMKPILDETEMAECKKLSKEFLEDQGPKLQWWLRLKWWISPNYVTDWWLNYVYLRGRDPLPINSNWYGVTNDTYRPTSDMAARAASCLYNFLQIKRSLDNETFPALTIAGMAPLCMAQYEYAFATTRIPGREQDQIMKAEASESKHVVVIFRGKFYKLSCYSPNTNHILTPLQLYHALQGLISSSDETDQEEAAIPALTTMNRTEWSDVRENFFLRNEYNRQRLELIEKAAFILTLEPDSKPGSLSEEAKWHLCGTGRSFWCDKSFNLVVNGDCQCGAHVEHGWGDAPAMAHCLEMCTNQEILRTNYNDDGSIRALPEDIQKQKAGHFHVYPAERIHFQVTKQLSEITKKALVDHQARTDELELHTLRFTDYGKNCPKKARCSPDSWLQMAFQLAYFRDQGRFDQTYEASMTRLFGLGRTETVRSACDLSAKFVQTMEDKSASKEQKLKALQAACNYHQHKAQDAMIGKGCDRHLFALYVVSVGKSIDSPFLKYALGRKWKLSTSQTPNTQTGKLKVRDDNEPKYRTPNGGFGPVADDGYGISYVLYQTSFYFNISAKNIKSNTSADRLAERIRQALLEMGDLIDFELSPHKYDVEKDQVVKI